LADKDADRHIERDRDGDDAYFGQKVYIDNYTKKQGRAPASTTLLWPKCYRHPDRSTRDRCSSCKRPICAMCTRPRGGKIYCPSCMNRTSRVLKVTTSGKYSGFGGSFLEAVRESLFHPAIFFRNLPSSGGVAQPFIYSLFAWTIGSFLALGVIWYLGFRKEDLSLDTLIDSLVRPLLFGGLSGGAAVSLLGWIPLHLFATGMGGDGSANKTFRAFSLASGFHFLVFIPFVGWPLGVLLSLWSLPRALAETHRLSIILSFFLYLFFLSSLVGLYFGIALLVFAGE